MNCTYKAKIQGSPRILINLVSKIKNKESLTFKDNDYSTLFKIHEVEFFSSLSTNIFTQINHFDEDDFCEISGKTDTNLVEEFWEKLSDEYSLEVELEYYFPNINLAGIVKFESGVIVDNYTTSYWQYLYDFDKDLFWENIFESSKYHKVSEIVDVLSNTYECLSFSEKEKLLVINRKVFDGL